MKVFASYVPLKQPPCRLARRLYYENRNATSLSEVVVNMRVKAVRYSMLRVTAQFENDRAEVEVELGPKDTVEDAILEAKAQCRVALRVDLEDRESEFEALMFTSAGRAAFDRLAREQGLR